MAQSAVTVRMDSEMKTQFDALCEQFGMSANTAFNIFVKAVIRSRSIPFAIKGSPSALDLFMQQRSTAELSQEPELSLDEINEEIRAAREEISVDEYLCTINYDYPQFHLTMHCYLCSLVTEALHLNEHEAAKWLEKDELDSVKWLPADFEVLEEVRSKI